MLLKKISNKQHQLCYAHTCQAFTAGHVSDQRMEQGMAAMKANGKLKSYLSGCTYNEAVSRISQVARDQDYTALKELQLCRENHKKVGLKYADALINSKAAAMKFSFVEQTIGLNCSQLIVKEADSSTAFCEVDLDTNVSWRAGGQFVFGITHYGRKPSNHYSCLTTRILHIILLLIWILPASPMLITILIMIPWTIQFDAIIQKYSTRLVILVTYPRLNESTR